MTLRSFLTMAQAETQSFRTTELDLPESTIGILLLAGGLLLLFGVTSWASLRDSRFLKTPWRVTLLVLRVLVLLLVLVVLLNPRQRTQTTQIKKSRVGILVDTSLSMAYSVADRDSPDSTGTENASRAEAVQAALIESGLLDQLSKTHFVSVFSFDGSLEGPRAIISDQQTVFVRDSDPQPDSENDGKAVEPSSGSDATRVDLADTGQVSAAETRLRWQQILQPTGAETRLGEALYQLIGDLSDRTLSGIVIVTDGRSTGELNPDVARLRAESTNTRLITVGTGSTQPQVNVWLAGMKSPSHVHRGDPFDISVEVQGSGLARQGGSVRLYQQTAGGDGGDRREIAKKAFTLPEKPVPDKFNPDKPVPPKPVPVSFQQQLNVPGKYEYVAIAELDDGELQELTLDDNQRRREVEVTDRKQKVLMISSGPMRDYRFVRNMLFRHSGIELDVWLQTISSDDVGFVSQEAERVLTAFPKTEAELFQYDVIIAFDADWSLLTAEKQKFLNRWVDEHSGGIIFVAGDLYTPELARNTDKFRDVTVLYPVQLNQMLAELRITQRADKPWPVLLTPEGRTTEFLRIADATGKSDVDVWKAFKGIYRSYPVKAERDGAVVLARYGNPRVRTRIGQPPFLATQLYGKGRTMFVSSAETWRLRSISVEGHQRFWTGMIREVGQGRRSRGRTRGTLRLSPTEATPGQTITIHTRMYDTRLQPLQRDAIPISIIDADGRRVNVPSQLRNDMGRGRFVNTFRPPRQGTYRVTVPVPDSSDVLQASIEVVLPNLEAEDPSRNVTLLQKLTKDTGGTYLSLDDVVGELPGLLPDRSEPEVLDERLTELWDRMWLMFLIVGLLALEWALRRVVRLS